MKTRHEKGHFDHLSNWYLLVADLTFETTIIDITQEQGQAISKMRECGRQISAMYNFATTKEEKEEVLGKYEPIDMLPSHLRDALLVLEARVDQVIRDCDYHFGVFVRMDTRSPKDAVLNGSRVKELLKEEIESRKHEDVFSEECFSDDAIAYWRAISKAQQVFSGSEAIELLVRSNRVQEDLTLGMLEHSSSIPLIIRKWEDISPEYEFRVFVVNQEITAITQYHHLCFVKEIVDNSEYVLSLILDAFSQIKDIPICEDQTYTVDFVLLTPEQCAKQKRKCGKHKCKKGGQDVFHCAQLVEINDPPPTAGTSLFDWDNEKDRDILQNGPLTFRVNERCSPWEDQVHLHPPLKAHIDFLRGRASVPDHNHKTPQGTPKNNCSIS
eukprot:CAMPEP_0174255558 /NCGR_PEP_ID=MMETSP0439-20130205/4877_1 /TAXON_ID=0 /ORGANISM="Stereomyxa ramosa, Strain Chinc5" /LENGTH=383 /DNA_ID=CAMNT_0015337785 /DNA_START=1 /DNA_END=1152 /DNA_ORIENTATION=-